MEPATCAKCELEYAPYFRAFERFFWRRPCPDCKATSRRYTDQIADTAKFYEESCGKIKNNSYRSKQKIRGWFFFGQQWSVGLGKFVQKSVSADKYTDTYSEKITDIESGKVIHECHESLRNHQGHGFAKFKEGRREP
jgi:predicted nucleic-acid-binding Zn-ribbon protein